MQTYSKIKSPLLLSIFLIIGLIIAGQICLAQGTVIDQVKEKNSGCIDNGNCQLSDFMLVAIQVAQIVLGISGSAALLAFVAGGVMFLASGGNKTWIDRGKAAITGAVIGLVIVFASWTIIGFVFKAFDIPNAGKWYESNWFKK